MRTRAIAIVTGAIVATCTFYVLPVPEEKRTQPASSASVQWEAGRPVTGSDAHVPRPLTTAESTIDRSPIDAALAMPNGLLRNQTLERACFEATFHAPEAALDALAQITNAGDRATALRGIFSAAAHLDVSQAITLLKSFEGSFGENELAMRTLAESWRSGEPFTPAGVRVAPLRSLGLSGEMGRWVADKRPDAAEVWANELISDPEVRLAVLASVAYVTQENPARAQAMMADMTPEEKVVFLEQFGALFLESPMRGREWARRLPHGELRTAAWTQLCRVFAGDETLAKQMYAELPAGAGRTEGITALAQGWWKRDQKGAATWAASLPGNDQVVARTALQQARSAGNGDQ